MKEYEFTLKFSLKNTKENPEKHLGRLAAEGCDDAIVGIGQNGRIALSFTREASNAFDAVYSALSDVKRAIPGAALVEATPDFVGLTDVAKLLGFTRQNLRKLMIASGAEFPTPVHEGKPAIWHLAKVLDWLKKRKKYRIEDSLIEVAKATMQFNVMKETTELDPDLQKQIRPLIS
ncbi:MAG: DNA-binding protein [Deltaproteobacteria bacterium]|nr:DNA-binding protein [Deltaproteobacteria bacterium]